MECSRALGRYPTQQLRHVLAPAGPGGSAGIDTGIRFVTGKAEADHADLQAAGVDVDPEIMRWPGVPPMFGLRDPDGNRLYIVESM